MNSHLHAFLLGLLQEKLILALQGLVQRVCGGSEGRLLGQQRGPQGLPPSPPPFRQTAPKYLCKDSQGRTDSQTPKGFIRQGREHVDGVQKGEKTQGRGTGVCPFRKAEQERGQGATSTHQTVPKTLSDTRRVPPEITAQPKALGLAQGHSLPLAQRS